MMSRRTFAHRAPAPILCSAVLVLAAACSDDPAGPDAPTMAAIAGDYSASGSFGAFSFTTTSRGESIDWLALGAELTLELATNGTVSGQIRIPVPEGPWSAFFEKDDLEQGSFGADMAGTWTLNSSTVEFQQRADTFVRDIDFVYHDGVLTGGGTFGGVQVRVVLVKR